MRPAPRREHRFQKIAGRTFGIIFDPKSGSLEVGSGDLDGCLHHIVLSKHHLGPSGTSPEASRASPETSRALPETLFGLQATFVDTNSRKSEITSLLRRVRGATTTHTHAHPRKIARTHMRKYARTFDTSSTSVDLEKFSRSRLLLT